MPVKKDTCDLSPDFLTPETMYFLLYKKSATCSVRISGEPIVSMKGLQTMVVLS